MHKTEAIAADPLHHAFLNRESGELTAQIDAGNLQHISGYQECAGARLDQRRVVVQAVGEDIDRPGREMLGNVQFLGLFGFSTNSDQSERTLTERPKDQDQVNVPFVEIIETIQ